MKTIVEKNRMIAEFMGLRYGRSSVKTYVIENNKEVLPKDLKYHTSWDWLMPVVEKIESLGYEFQITKEEAYFKDTDGDFEIVASAFNGSIMDNTYNAVVQFIEWFNENK